jgi:hypothetical protein
MLARACLLAWAISLPLSAGAASLDPAGSAPPRLTGPREPAQDLELPRFRWGLPESPFPLMEAERKLFGFHFEFEFGGGDTPPRRQPLLR